MPEMLRYKRQIRTNNRGNKMSRINIDKCSQDELYEECERVVGTQYGHNMIGLICNAAEKRFGKEVAEDLFETYQI